MKNFSSDNVTKLNPYFHVDPRSLCIKDSVFKCRGIIINEKFWNRIRNELTSLTSEASSSTLYQLGRSYGWEVGAQGKDAISDSTAVISFLQYYGLSAGWGRFETSELQLSQSGMMESAVVKVFDNFFAFSNGNSKVSSCLFVSGLLAGIADGLFNGHYNCHERECLSMGAQCCEFVIRKVS
jgi:predicted hydrocarbon binding protein